MKPSVNEATLTHPSGLLIKKEKGRYYKWSHLMKSWDNANFSPEFMSKIKQIEQPLAKKVRSSKWGAW